MGNVLQIKCVELLRFQTNTLMVTYTLPHVKIFKSIITKGNLKIAISTNGKSPTLAKRIRQWLEGFLPEETDALLDKLYEYRNSLKGDFEQKIVAMNALTEKLLKKND